MPRTKQCQKVRNELRCPLSFVKSPDERPLMPLEINGCEALPTQVRSVPYTEGGSWVDGSMPYTATQVLQETQRRPRGRLRNSVRGQSQCIRRTKRYVPLDVTITSITEEAQLYQMVDGQSGTHSEAGRTSLLDIPNEEEMTVIPVSDIPTPVLALEPSSPIRCSSTALPSVRTVPECFKNVDQQPCEDIDTVLAPDTPACEYGLTYRMRQLKRKLV